MKIEVPISLGELYDKITILKIKQEQIKDKEKLISINKELNSLNKIAEKYPIDDSLYNRLKSVNVSLWNIEDCIREKERDKDFDNLFIKYARLVYKSNDLRAKIKREINERYNSDIIEEKSYKEYE